ncbi:putative oxalocrotonate tautomerase [Roridomyces roridus]|uniref:Oxalocrotonate tautomerase n=1 Tax=Roridomyces roridus TaxID=1738132 RepID=A0AAD7F792_9AGAR|nr:putative oxalocrotonate tautomerase [Roridomyces roridus]
MPLHRFFVPKGLYSPEDKTALSAVITRLYTSRPISLPAFYVVVLFIEIEPGNMIVGGDVSRRMVRIAVEHVARNFNSSDAQKRLFMSRYANALKPFTNDRGIDWEVQVTDCDRLLWNLNGMHPPESNTEEERIWKRENRAVSFEEMEAFKARL